MLDHLNSGRAAFGEPDFLAERWGECEHLRRGCPQSRAPALEGPLFFLGVAACPSSAFPLFQPGSDKTTTVSFRRRPVLVEGPTPQTSPSPIHLGVKHILFPHVWGPRGFPFRITSSSGLFSSWSLQEPRCRGRLLLCGPQASKGSGMPAGRLLAWEEGALPAKVWGLSMGSPPSHFHASCSLSVRTEELLSMV